MAIDLEEPIEIIHWTWCYRRASTVVPTTRREEGIIEKFYWTRGVLYKFSISRNHLNNCYLCSPK